MDICFFVTLFHLEICQGDFRGQGEFSRNRTSGGMWINTAESNQHHLQSVINVYGTKIRNSLCFISTYFRLHFNAGSLYTYLLCYFMVLIFFWFIVIFFTATITIILQEDQL